MPEHVQGEKKTVGQTLPRLLICLAILLPCVLCGVLAAALEEARQSGADSQSGEPPASSSLEDPAPPPEEIPVIPAEVPSWQALYPDLYAQPAERGSQCPEKVVYLTFDDGPSARTPEVLDILAAYGIKATFFVTGRESEQGQ